MGDLRPDDNDRLAVAVGEIERYLANATDATLADERRVVGQFTLVLGDMCARGVADGRALGQIEVAVLNARLGVFMRLLFLSTLAMHYRDARLPDEADRLVTDVVAELSSAFMDPDEADQVLNVSALVLDELGQTERAEELRGRVLRLHGDGPLEEYMAELPYWEEMETTRVIRRTDAFYDLLDRCVEPADPATLADLEQMLALGDVTGYQQAVGWRRLGVLRSLADDHLGMWVAFGRAWEAATQVQTAEGALAGQIALLIAEQHYEAGDRERSAQWLREAVGLFFSVRDAAADPTVRRAYSSDGDWVDDLVFLAVALDQGATLFRCVAGVGAHGLEDLVRSPEPGHHETVSVPKRFAAVWAPEPPDPWVLADALPAGTAALHVALVRRFGVVSAVVQVLLDGDLITTRSPVPDELVHRTFPLSATRSLLMRPRDWQAWSDLLLPSELVEAIGRIDSMVVAPTGSLASLPFAYLPTEAGRLGDRCVVTTVPQLPLWARLPHVPTGLDSVVFVGVDTAEHATLGVAGVDKEIALLHSLGVEVHQARSLEDLQAAPGVSAWVFAVHGDLVADRNVFRFPDGTVVASDALAELTAAPLCIVGACWSGSLHGDPSPFSLVPAAMLAGARALVMALWDAEAHATTRVLQAMYPLLTQGLGVAEALAVAQRSQAAAGVAAYSLAALAR